MGEAEPPGGAGEQLLQLPTAGGQGLRAQADAVLLQEVVGHEGERRVAEGGCFARRGVATLG